MGFDLIRRGVCLGLVLFTGRHICLVCLFSIRKGVYLHFILLSPKKSLSNTVALITLYLCMLEVLHPHPSHHNPHPTDNTRKYD